MTVASAGVRPQLAAPPHPTTGNQEADLTITLTRPQLLQLLATAQPGAIGTSGDPAVLGRLMSLIDNPDPDFAIVTP
jgi:linear primary-alkylsulfatase